MDLGVMQVGVKQGIRWLNLQHLQTSTPLFGYLIHSAHAFRFENGVDVRRGYISGGHFIVGVQYQKLNGVLAGQCCFNHK